MLPSTACALRPRRGKHSRRLRSRKAPARKSGGAFLPTARQAGPSHRDRRRCHGNRVPRTGTFARRRACRSRPTSGRNTHPARRRGLGIAEAFHDAWRGASAMPRPPWTGRQVFMRTTRPSTPTTEASTAEPRRPKPSAPDDPPWEGLKPPANTHHPNSPLQGRLEAGNAARRFRVLKGRVSRVCDRNNRGQGSRMKNPVSSFAGRTQLGA